MRAREFSGRRRTLWVGLLFLGGFGEEDAGDQAFRFADAVASARLDN